MIENEARTNGIRSLVKIKCIDFDGGSVYYGICMNIGMSTLTVERDTVIDENLGKIAVATAMQNAVDRYTLNGGEKNPEPHE